MFTWFSHHRHTGRILPHHHTSYPALAMLLLVVGIGLLGVSQFASADVQVQSGNIQVNGLVPGPPPGQAPQIVSPASGTHVTSATQEVTGNCIAGLVVVIARGGIDAGSALCQLDGTFSLTIQLITGKNDLTARQYDGLGQSSPASAVVSLFYDLPAKPTNPAQPPVPAPKPGQPPVPLVPPLVIQTGASYLGVFAGSTADVSLSLLGGDPPYALNIDWGDGADHLISQPSAGTHHYRHTYISPNSYVVLIKATDIKGLSAYYQTLILVAGASKPASEHNEIGSQLLIAWPLYCLLIVMMASFWLGEKYDSHRWHAKT